MSATDVAAARVSRRRADRKPMTLSQRRARWGLLFLTPWFIGFLAFQLLPIVSTVFLSFTDYSATKEFTFDNFHLVGPGQLRPPVHRSRCSCSRWA